ncbi:nucleoside diphosphate kinase regulator [Phosphitispora fastidiosa]|uniref:nucleoside diphosphate kinase regulator n=1 Tax=Phosphitispora fastidiosa TaxID=2837202 RepID=UPI001E41AB31|nr:regulator of nucleoside diphosphate kinase [Phosphitispora fastidiosa]
MNRQIFITEVDKNRLQKLIDEVKEFTPGNKGYLENLERELSRALVVDSKMVPPDVITMNSKVVLKDLESGEEMTYTLVYPADAELLENKVSVMAPIGTAILGYSVGNVIEWEVPGGMVQLRVERILYQPEAAGDLEL